MIYGVITPAGEQILGNETSIVPFPRLIAVPVAINVVKLISYNSTLLKSEGPAFGTKRHVSFIPILPHEGSVILL
jgi:hypothetical protein